MRRLVTVVGAALLITLAVRLGAEVSDGGAAGSAQARWDLVQVGTIGRPSFYVDQFEPAINDRGQVAYMRAGHAVVWQAGRITRPDIAASVASENTFPTAINEQGQVVGMSYCGGCSASSERPWVWRNGRLAGLGVGTNPFNGAAYPALNDRGQVVGMGENLHAFLWQDARVSDLGSLPGRPYSDAVAINDRGQVVGRSYVATNEYDERIGPRAFLWSRGKMRDLGALPGDTYSTPDAINERGQIIGRSYSKSAKFSYGGTAEFEWWEGAHAFVWENGTMARLAGTDARVSDINDRGQIVGSVKRSGRRHAVLWRDGKTIDLGLLPGRSESQASAVNERGQVIGTSGQRAFVWQNGKMTALPVLAGMTRYSAVDINERGEVLGTTLDKRGEPQMVLLWTPKR